jgi:hypothetical protein
MDGWFGPFLEIQIWPEYLVLWLQPTTTLHKQQAITNRGNTFVAEKSHLLHKQASKKASQPLGFFKLPTSKPIFCCYCCLFVCWLFWQLVVGSNLTKK